MSEFLGIGSLWLAHRRAQLETSLSREGHRHWNIVFSTFVLVPIRGRLTFNLAFSRSKKLQECKVNTPQQLLHLLKMPFSKVTNESMIAFPPPKL